MNTMKTIHKAAAAVGVSILGACAWAGTRADAGGTGASSASSPLAASASASTQQAWSDPRQAVASAASAAPSASGGEGFRPSEFAGVSVRERPSSTSGAAGGTGARGWIAVKPGEPLTTKVPGAAGMRRATTGWNLKPTRLGGKKLISPSLIHRSEVTRSPRPQGEAQKAGR